MWMLPATRSQNGRGPIYSARFPFTHHQITLRLFSAKTRPRKSGERWFPIERLEEIPIPSPHRRAIFSVITRLGSE
jgi:hypothetical protein